jgi:hypothetical protein
VSAMRIVNVHLLVVEVMFSMPCCLWSTLHKQSLPMIAKHDRGSARLKKLGGSRTRPAHHQVLVEWVRGNGAGAL